MSKLAERLLATIEAEARGGLRAAIRQAIADVGRDQAVRIVWEELGWLPVQKARSTEKRAR